MMDFRGWEFGAGVDGKLGWVFLEIFLNLKIGYYRKGGLNLHIWFRKWNVFLDMSALWGDVGEFSAQDFITAS